MLQVVREVEDQLSGFDEGAFRASVDALLRAQGIALSYEDLLGATVSPDGGGSVRTTSADDIPLDASQINEYSMIESGHLRDCDVVLGSAGDDTIHLGSGREIVYYGQGRGNDDVFLSTGTRLELRLANLKADQIGFKTKRKAWDKMAQSPLEFVQKLAA